MYLMSPSDPTLKYIRLGIGHGEVSLHLHARKGYTGWMYSYAFLIKKENVLENKLKFGILGAEGVTTLGVDENRRPGGR